MSFLTKLSIILLGTACCMAVGQDGAGATQSTVVKSKTLSWESERDLVLLLNTSENRKLTAFAIINAADTSLTLTDEVKIDGYKVAGSVLYAEGAIADALLSFQSGIALDPEPLAKAELLAAAGELYKKMDIKSELAYTNYKLATDLYLSLSPNNEIPRTPIILGLFLDLGMHSQVDHNEEMLEYAELGAEKYPGNNYGPYFIETAIGFAEKTGDFEKAISLCDRILDDYPNFLINEPLLGAIPSIMIKKSLLSGANWIKPSGNLIDTVLSIKEDSRFALMPVRYNAEEKLARAWVDQGQYAPAADLRASIVMNINDALASLSGSTMNETSLERALVEQREVTKWNRAYSLCYDQGDLVGALFLIDEIINETLHPVQEYIEYAEGLRLEIMNTPAP